MDANNALNGVLVLQKLIKKICNDKNVIIQNTKSIEFILNSKARLQKNKENSKSLSDLKISKAMKGKISKAGINKRLLKQVV